MSTPDQIREIRKLNNLLELRNQWRTRGRNALLNRNADGFTEAFNVLTEIDTLLVAPETPTMGQA